MERFTIIVALFLFTFSVLSCKSSRQALPKTSDGFDFSYGGGADESWSGPKIGERIELARLKDRQGNPLVIYARDRVAMLVLIDPECGACQAALDQLQAVRDRIGVEGVPYYLISVTSSVPANDFFAYADSLELGSAIYLWKASELRPPRPLYSMVLPSHILIRPDGAIVRKWPGTSISEYDRARMVNQIVADTLRELHPHQ